MEIPKNRFMTLLKDGVMLVYKKDIQSAHFFPSDKNNLNQEDLKLLNKYLEEKKITKSDIEEENSKKERVQLTHWDANVEPGIDPSLGAFTSDDAECRNNIIGSWN
ncbi:hypothetical protein SUGI_1192710 [Cryptomeria japonica]|nr:hypothetical protein SUGI_1192710 [Cryptomeria japonica]